MPKYNLKLQKDRNNFEKERSKLNKIELDTFLQKNKDKNIVFVGIDFDGMEKIPKIVTHKYSIKIDSEILFRQYNLRTLYLLSKYKKDIEKLLKLCLGKCYFLWDNKTFVIKDAGPIGFSLMVTTEIYLQFFEAKALRMAFDFCQKKSLPICR